MIWAKTPAAASSIFCAVCIATAAVLPAVGPAADRLANAVSADVNLKVNWGALANFDAVPIFQAAAAGDPTAIFALGSLNAIPAYLTFGLTGNTDALAALDSLSAVPVYAAAQAAGTGDPALLAGIDAFSGVPSLQAIANGDRTGYYGLDSTNATQAFDKWAASNYTDLSAFEPSDTNAGYAALSGANTWSKANASGNVADLAGIDAFSAIPALQTLGNPASTQADIWAAQRSLASVSAIPEYQDAPVPDPDAPPSGDSLALAKTTSVETPAAAIEETTKKSSNGSYSAKFTPAGAPVLFGSGGGKNAADNGIRGWGDAVNGLRASVGLGPDPSTQSADPGTGGATP
ncbi:hypothetical protein [Mycobacterium sp. AZCC_0083]|uniref:hypothetical protein n=1 Tax=Mycobacterium sp. AZCC_0083 TaxID=2735882 RepID=UPI00160EC4BD|nr:hypothetical protein [Mycobacterium sp. AZCC_0083]MBB5162593.1 hypothetical protein [Mycobacterium sp. AZCC_0083]